MELLSQTGHRKQIFCSQKNIGTAAYARIFNEVCIELHGQALHTVHGSTSTEGPLLFQSTENQILLNYRWFGMTSKQIKKRRAGGMQSSNWKWHLDEVFVKINGERHYLWRAVDHEGEVLESYVTKKRDKRAALKFMKKAMRRYGSPNEIVTDKLGSYGAAARELGCSKKQVTKRWANNRVENSHLPFRRRERAMLRFRQMHSLQKFASIHASFHNLFNSHRSLSKRSTFKLNRDAALNEWRSLVTS